MFCKMSFLTSEIYLKAIFCICQGFLHQPKILILPVLQLEYNKTCYIEFVLVKTICQVVKNQSRLNEYSRFLSYVKQTFWRWLQVDRKEYTSASLQNDCKYIIPGNNKYLAARVQI